MLKKSLIVFIFEIVTFWILWFIYGFVWREGNVGTAQVMKIVAYVLMAVIIATAIISFVILIHEASKGFQLKTELLFVLFIILHLVLYIMFFDIGKISGGVFEVKNKAEENGKYYIYIEKDSREDEVKINLDYENYQNINLDNDTEYSFSYRWLKILPDQGVLEKNSLLD